MFDSFDVNIQSDEYAWFEEAKWEYENEEENRQEDIQENE